jgi:DNA-binding response OmpR family regulator
MPTILVIDDEASIRELVSLYLTSAGFAVEVASDGSQGLALFKSLSPDLVVLDLMLPGMHGREVCSAIRETSSAPILMLTARDTDLDKVALLEAGADDYVVKPFSPPELVARVRALLRRSTVAPAARNDAEERVEVGGLTMDLAERAASVDGAPLTLTTREFDLLVRMAAAPGVVFSREQLLESSTGFAEYAEARGVDVHVRHLREKLGDDAAKPRFIETVRGVGYRLRKDAS